MSGSRAFKSELLSKRGLSAAEIAMLLDRQPNAVRMAPVSPEEEEPTMAESNERFQRSVFAAMIGKNRRNDQCARSRQRHRNKNDLLADFEKDVVLGTHLLIDGKDAQGQIASENR